MGCNALLQGSSPNPGIEPRSPASQADSLPSEPQGKPLFSKLARKSLEPGGAGKGEEVHWIIPKISAGVRAPFFQRQRTRGKLRQCPGVIVVAVQVKPQLTAENEGLVSSLAGRTPLKAPRLGLGRV